MDLLGRKPPCGHKSEGYYSLGNTIPFYDRGGHYRRSPDDYITSGNAGGQSVSFPSLSDMLAFYRGLKADLLAEAAVLEGNDTGRFMKFDRPAVGGV
jgi:hypothetical protein